MNYREFLEETPDAFFAHDMTGRITDVNRQACVSLGYSREELLNMSVVDIEQDFSPAEAQLCWERAKPGEASTFFGRHKRKDGSVFPVEIHMSIHVEGDMKTVLGMVHDITNRREAERRQERLTKLYRALSEINQAIVRMEEEETLFPLVCRIAVEFGGMSMSWIGKAGRKDRIEPVASHGSGLDYLAGLSISSSADVPEGRGPSGTAFRENRSVIVNDLRSDPLMNHWMNAAIAHGFESCASFPVFRGEQPFAVFTVYHELANAFDSETVGLLDEMARDISFALDNFDRDRESKQAEEALRRSEEKFSTIFRNSPNPTSITRLTDGKIIEINEAWSRITGYDRIEAIGRTAVELSIWKKAEDRRAAVEELKKHGRISAMEFVFTNRSGGEIVSLVSAEMFEMQGEECIILIAQDISELRRAMETIREQNNFLNAVFDSEPHCVKVVGKDGKLIQMNKAGLAMFEVDTLEEVQASGLEVFILPEYRKTYAQFHESICAGNSGVLEIPIAGKKRTMRWLETHATPLRNVNGEIVALLGVTRDVTARKQSEELIWKQANFDLLTNLPNRYMFYDRLEHEIKKAHQGGGSLALFFIDLDEFKEVNDTLGHQIGDRLLIEAARRISSCLEESDTLARLGGDEFTVIFRMRDTVQVETVAQRILDALAEPYAMEGKLGKIYVSASIGITLYPSDAPDPEQLLKNADQALYVAKHAGRNRFGYFTKSLQEKAQSRRKLLNDLRYALQDKQFALYFQPVVDLSSGRAVRAEALLRWMHPVRGIVSPLEFIPLAEETGLITQIGDWVFREAAKWGKLWAARYPDLKISVNMSPLQFRSENISSWLDHLEEIGFSGRNMVIEITEGLLLDADSEVMDRLIEFRDAEIEVAIDDFGTGYSALSYLKKFDIDYLKIDRSFIRDIAENPSDMALSEAIVVMAHKLGLKVIAEGVETVKQLELLSLAGCDYAQGYLFSVPVPADEFEDQLGDGRLNVKDKGHRTA